MQAQARPAAIEAHVMAAAGHDADGARARHVEQRRQQLPLGAAGQKGGAAEVPAVRHVDDELDAYLGDGGELWVV